MLQLPWIVKVTHTFKKGNKVANGLASMAFSRLVGRCLFMQSPDEILQTLHDYSGVAWPHIV
ncbi:hypothetical protein PVK06_003856 [Gossypium arboreum]|uniref:RNase H type-1 domain-containing protein n=1 Tax=Gossypium arboreum TaxID=29729 RepID=A0ABR0QQN4_GOSAR|nr:hypothetical protein PVK06_003856 [Gossypium arboreum]